MKKVNISISVETHTKAKLIAILKNTTLNDYLQQAIADAIKQDEDLVKTVFDKKNALDKKRGGKNE